MLHALGHCFEDPTVVCDAVLGTVPWPSVFSQRESSSFSLWLLLPLVQELGFILDTLGDCPGSSQDGDSRCARLSPAGQALTCLPVAGARAVIRDWKLVSAGAGSG